MTPKGDPQDPVCPPIPKPLLEYLDRLFPDRCASRDDTHATCMWKGGQRDVVNHLRIQFEEQQQTVLDGPKKRR